VTGTYKPVSEYHSRWPEYLALETKPLMYGEYFFFQWSAGESHTELRDDLEDLRGSSALKARLFGTA
jgi:hypothetical protein